MKKVIIYIILFGLTIQNVQAQLDYAVKAGGNISYYRLNKEAAERQFNYNIGLGLQLGVVVVHDVSKKSDFIAELIYAKKGSDRENFHYLDLPVLMNYRLGEFCLETGTEVGFLIFARDDSDFILTKSPYQKRFDLSILMGCSYNINDKIGVNLRYVRGILPSVVIPVEEEKLKFFNTSIQ